MIRICLADDHPVFVAGIEALIRREPGLTLAGTAATGPHALDLLRRERPDVAVLDISMPGADGIAVTAQLTAEASPTRIIIMSVFEDPHYVRAAIAAGARGYVLKRSAADQLLVAIAAVQQGDVHIDPKAAGRLLTAEVEHRAGKPQAADALTVREGDVLRGTALGFTIKELATQFGITTKSVETYKRRAIEKLNLRSRAKIVNYAIGQGWFAETVRDEARVGRVTTAAPRPHAPRRS